MRVPSRTHSGIGQYSNECAVEKAKGYVGQDMLAQVPSEPTHASRVKTVGHSLRWAFYE
jgi:hypothetical protein